MFACSHPPRPAASGQFPAEASKRSSFYRPQRKDSEMKQAVVLCVASCLVSLAFSAAIPEHARPLDPNHVPSSVCESMVPIHNDSKPSTDPAPYTITPSKTNVSPGEVIQVVITGKSGEVYKGFYMQVRKVEGGSEALGKFTLSNLYVNPAIRVSTCPPGTENAISYVSRTAVETLTLEWEAPESFSGTVYFRIPPRQSPRTNPDNS
ncbi:hypothetical protein J437_LFUL013484 [Ladona fulva]|uniref:Reelin domain-containing protein n=1 Tax=Ladona fulva TaxID=123851 RepID=A0A8K0P730_LADFU|nr:hypothetical protein J437_LFUL013484 [Ladona fulva]